MLLTVAVIELSDIAFAVDSIPAVFGVTRDPFVVFTSNLFAILGLRSLFLIISEGMSELKYLQVNVDLVCFDIPWLLHNFLLFTRLSFNITMRITFGT